MAPHIRRLGPDDWRVLREVRLRALADAPYAFGSTVAEESAWDDQRWASSTSRLTWFVAGDDRRPVGLVAGVQAPEDADARAVISMWVAPGHRGTPLGRSLLDAVERWARAEGATALLLRVSDRNDRARRFYERLGFVTSGQAEPLRSDRSVNAVEMRRALPSACLRFAPSPAGLLHVGHLRNAVLTWMTARQLNGRYFVRFENTDRAKEVAGSREEIVADLEWVGLLGTAPPRDQDAMTGTHRAALDRLTAGGHTYHDGGAIRFRTASGGVTEWDDMVRGTVSVRDDDLDDPVLVRSSGSPTFFLASTVDDIEDGVTHLVRAVPMLRATAAQVQIWRALGAEPPRSGHVPLVTGPGRAPLRFGATDATVRAVRAQGIHPDALLAYTALPETASWKRPPAGLDELIPRLDLRRLARRPMTFDARALALLDGRRAALLRDPDIRRHVDSAGG